jgi:hypothetical protein
MSANDPKQTFIGTSEKDRIEGQRRGPSTRGGNMNAVAVSFGFAALLVLQGCASPKQLHVFNGLVTDGGSGAKFEEVALTAIHRKDTIYVVTHVRWDPPNTSGGSHSIAWNWYLRDKLIATRTMELTFDKTPYRFWYRIPAANFDLGHYRVEVSIDGTVVDTQEYDVVQ